jgi:hypothetical protein
MVVSRRRIGLTLTFALAVAGLWLAWDYASLALTPVNKGVIRAQVKEIGGDEQTVRAATHAVRRETHDRSAVLAIVTGAVAVVAGVVSWRRLRTEPKRWKLVWYGLFLSIPVGVALLMVMNRVYDAASGTSSF